jgi:hypothetical protein
MYSVNPNYFLISCLVTHSLIVSYPTFSLILVCIPRSLIIPYSSLPLPYVTMQLHGFWLFLYIFFALEVSVALFSDELFGANLTYKLMFTSATLAPYFGAIFVV